MFVDMHVHTGGISLCCKIDYTKALEVSKENGYDAVVITNHYTKSYFTDKNYDQWIEKYIEEFYKCRKYGQEIGIKCFFGIELTSEENPCVHFLIYGANEQFLRNNKLLCDKTQEELYRLCRENDCALVQAHPFRGCAVVQNTDFLDGVEINCHPLYKNSYYEKIIMIAKEKNIAVTVGCDYHGDTYRPKGGMFLPDYIENGKELADYILKSNKMKVQIHEPRDNVIREITLTKTSTCQR